MSAPQSVGVRRSPQDDPRYKRVRAALVSALVELAKERNVDDISVSELTGRAGVARQTFYKHAPSPAHFLADYLTGQLEPHFSALAKLLGDGAADTRERLTSIYVAIMEVIARDPEIYSQVFVKNTSSSVRALFATRLEEVFRTYVADFAARLEWQATDLWVEMAVSQQLHNMIAIITAWLRTGMSASAREVVATYLTLAPPWQLVHLNESGKASMPRRGFIEGDK